MTTVLAIPNHDDISSGVCEKLIIPSSDCTSTLRLELGDISLGDEIYIVCGYTDIRKSINGLCALVKNELHMDPRRSALYLFCERKCDRINGTPFVRMVLISS